MELDELVSLAKEGETGFQTAKRLRRERRISYSKLQSLLFNYTARGYYYRNPLLQNIPEEDLQDSFALVRYLRENRGDMTAPVNREHNSLGYLVLALVM